MSAAADREVCSILTVMLGGDLGVELGLGKLAQLMKQIR